MYGHPIDSKHGTANRPTVSCRIVLAFLCALALFSSFLQPAFARASSNAAQATFVQSHSVKGGKPCQRAVPGALGTSCSVGSLIGLEINISTVTEPSHGKAGVVPSADKLLHLQWLAAPQFRPPRIGA
ncbi:hypothetical protein [Bradyrhizobium sp.]|uniref:hypothetical protein n=1 Tax=Bradyrhizobium sp. TaxID=376 RepID=UPI0025B7CA59|nr:hypothetical protein [Bradyrhizobium sp.]